MNREIVSSCFLNPQSYNVTDDPVFRCAFCTEDPFVEKQKSRGCVGGGSAGQGWFQVLGGTLWRAGCQLPRQAPVPTPHLSSLFCVRSKKSQSPHGNNFIFQWNLFQNYWNSMILLLIHKYSYKNNLSLRSLGERTWYKDSTLIQITWAPQILQTGSFHRDGCFLVPLSGIK